MQCRKTVLLALAAAALVAACGSVAPQSGADEPVAGSVDTAAVVEYANDYSHQVSSGRLLLRTDAVFLDDERSNFVREVEVWFDGVRARVEQRVERGDASPFAGNLEEHWIVFDGEKVVSTAPPEFRSALVTVPKYLSEVARYLGGVPPTISDLIHPAFNHYLALGDLIESFGGQVVGEQEVGQLPCLWLTTPPHSGGGAQTVRSWWLAPSKGYAPAQYSEDITWPTKGSAKRNVHTVEEWTQASDGIWIPKLVTKRVYVQTAGGDEELRRVDKTEVLSVALNMAVPDEVFDLDLPETTRIRQMD